MPEIDIDAMTPDERIAFINSCRTRVRRSNEDIEAGRPIAPENEISDDDLKAAIQALRLVRSSAAEKKTERKAGAAPKTLTSLEDIMSMGQPTEPAT